MLPILAVEMGMVPFSGASSVEAEEADIQSCWIILAALDKTVWPHCSIWGRTMESKHWVQSSL